MTPLKDTDLMPWGAHKGVPMSDVPVNYLHFMWTTRGLCRERTTVNPVAEYISRNLNALKMENKDLLW